MSTKCYVVDDERHNITLISEYIESTYGMELIGSSTNPVTALGEIIEKRPDVVFSDIRMPKMSGFEIADQVKSFAKVIFISAESQSSFPDIDWENYHFLRKLISYDDFIKILPKINVGHEVR